MEHVNSRKRAARYKISQIFNLLKHFQTVLRMAEPATISQLYMRVLLSLCLCQLGIIQLSRFCQIIGRKVISHCCSNLQIKNIFVLFCLGSHTEYHRLGAYKQQEFLTVLEIASLRPGCQHGGVLVRPPF